MTPGARFEAAISILDKFLEGEPINKVLLNWFRNNRFAGSKDRFSIRETVFNCLRFRRSSLWPFNYYGSTVCGRSWVLGLLILTDRRAVKFFNGDRFSPACISCEEKSVISSFNKVLEKAPISVQLDHPEFLEHLFRESLGQNYVSILKCLNSRAKLFLRVNLIRSTVPEAIKLLKSEKVEVRKCSYASSGLLVLSPINNIEKLDTYKSGKIEIQDISSQAVVDFIDPRGQIEILDYCAGSGGKTLAMASLVKFESKFFVHDKAPSRIKPFYERAKRAGIFAKTIRTSELNKGYKFFDLVVSDVPCSGTGAWRRNPEGKWWLSEVKLESLIIEQRDILKRSSRLVRYGGQFAYVTCSVLTSENRSQVDWFLSRNESFRLVRDIFISPMDGGDGFYAAILEKNKK